MRALMLIMGVVLLVGCVPKHQEKDCKFSKMKHADGYEYNPCGRHIRKIDIIK